MRSWYGGIVLLAVLTVHCDVTGAQDLCFVLDRSGSISDKTPPGAAVSNWDLLKEFVVHIVGFFDIGFEETRVGLVSFGTRARTRFYLNNYSDVTQLLYAIRQLPPGTGQTNLYDGLLKMRTQCFNRFNGDRPDVQNVAVVITDGTSNVNEKQTTTEAERAWVSGIAVFAVGVTDEVNESELKGISSPPHQKELNYWTSPDYRSLYKILEPLQEETCEKLVVPTVCREADIGFLVDSSGSIDEEEQNWPKILNFVCEVVKKLDIAPHRVRVGLYRYSSAVTFDIDLNTYFTQQELCDHILGLDFLGSSTSTADGLAALCTDMFDITKGDRQDVPNVGIVVSDGKSNIKVDQTKTQADACKNSGHRLLAVGVGNNTDVEELLSIASDDAVISVDNVDKLLTQLDDVINRACLFPTIPPIGPQCPTRADVALVIDGSTSIVFDGNYVWQDLLLGFAADVIESFPVGAANTRFSVVVFSDAAKTRVRICFDDFYNKEDLIRSLQTLPHEGGATNVAAALRTTRQDAFQSSCGHRDNVPSIAILLTDGRATAEVDRVPTEAQALKDAGVTVFAVGIADALMSELNIVASSPDYVFYVDEFRSLTTILSDVVQGACEGLPTFEPPQACDQELDVVFVVDSSGSLGTTKYAQVLDFVSDMVCKLPVQNGTVQVAVLIFSTDTRVSFYLNDFRSCRAMQENISNAPYMRKKTFTSKALSVVRTDILTSQRGARLNADGTPRVQQVIIVVTDGESSSVTDTLAEAALLRNQGAHIITVGIGNWLNLYELEAMASYPGSQNMFHVSDINVLIDQVSTLIPVLCSNQGQCNPNPCSGGASCITGINSYTCLCPVGQTRINCTGTCSTAADVVFVVDSSGSIKKNNFKKMTSFVTSVMQSLYTCRNASQQNCVRVGLVTFGDDTRLQCHLDDNLGQPQNIWTNCGNPPYTSGTTNTSGAIKFVHENMFDPAHGDRPGVSNYIVVLTDGKSDMPNETWAEARSARQDGIGILALGVGGGANVDELLGMVSAPPSENVYRVTDFDELNDDLRQWLSDALCNNSNACSPNPCLNGAECTDLANSYLCGPCPGDFTGTRCERGCTGIIDFTIIMDASGSIRKERFPILKEFVAGIIESLDVHPDRTRVGLIYFSDNAYRRFDLLQYDNRYDAAYATRQTPFLGGRTNMQAALKLLENQPGDRFDAYNLVLVVSDGNSNILQQNTIPEAITAKVAGNYILVLAVGKGFVNFHEVNSIASYPSWLNVHTVEQFEELENAVEKIVSSTCNDENACDSNPCQNGAVCTDTYEGYFCVCDFRNTGVNCERECTTRQDLVFVLDLSSSVADQFQLTLNLTYDIVSNLHVHNDYVRVGVITYSDDASEEFKLSKYQASLGDVEIALNFNRQGGQTNTADALHLARTESFTLVSGDRPFIDNSVILIHDGQSTVNTDQTISRASELKQEGVNLYVIGIGERIDEAQLNAIASQPASNYFFRCRSYDEAEQVVDSLLDRLCA